MFEESERTTAHGRVEGVPEAKHAASILSKAAAAKSVRDEGRKSGLPLFESDDGGIRSVDGKETYYMGIIDILQQYNGIKFVENFVMPIVR